MKLYIKQVSYLMLTSLLWFNLTALAAKERETVENMEPERISSNMKLCINLSGTYSLYGRSLPGKPSTFRGGKFALDEMMGIDLARGEKERVIYVELTQHGQEGIDLNFWDQMGMFSKKVITSAGHKFFCDEEKLIIEQSVATKGEAVSGRAQITHVLSLTDDRSLLIKLSIHPTSGRMFIFSYRGRDEEYWAQFNSVGKSGRFPLENV